MAEADGTVSTRWAEFSGHNQTVYEVLVAIGGWCSTAQVRQALVDQGLALTPSQVAHALYSLHESGPIDRPQIVERREAESPERTRGRWLFRRHVAEGA